MNGQIPVEEPALAAKIARLVEERGWNQEDLVRNSGLNRQTVRQILKENDGRRLRNGTVSRCARALGLSVNELRNLPLERLLTRVSGVALMDCDVEVRRLYAQATQPELLAWLERNPDRAGRLNKEAINELLSLQGTGGPLTTIGVQHFVELIERKRKMIEKIHTIAGTEYLDLLEQLVNLMFDKVQPYRDRA
jgi:transcriptional regulator with XRE-family HTH domain